MVGQAHWQMDSRGHKYQKLYGAMGEMPDCYRFLGKVWRKYSLPFLLTAVQIQLNRDMSSQCEGAVPQFLCEHIDPAVWTKHIRSSKMNQTSHSIYFHLDQKSLLMLTIYYILGRMGMVACDL